MNSQYTHYDTGCGLPDLQFSIISSFVNHDFINSGILKECNQLSVPQYLWKAPVSYRYLITESTNPNIINFRINI
jgi:hypothetical protein